MTRSDPQTIDYTKMARGTVTRTYKGRRVCVIAQCPKCGRVGERSVTIPKPEDRIRGGKPYVHVSHKVTVMKNDPAVRTFFGDTMRHVTDSCTLPIDKSNADDVLNIEERKRYDAFVDDLQAYVETFR